MKPPLFPAGHINGVRITVSATCFEMVPIFPDKPRTKRRMRRTRGKFGRLDRLNPLAYRTPIGLVVHPLIYDQMKRALASAPHERNPDP